MKRIKIVGLLLVSLLIFTGCNLSSKLNKEPLKSEEYKNKMEEKGYSTLDATGQFTQKFIKKVYLAVSNKSTYQIEFYEIDTIDNAKEFYSNNKKIFEESKVSGSSDSYVELGNHEKYTLKSGDTYKVISRIDNTIVYANVNKEYKNEVKKAIKEIGY